MNPIHLSAKSRATIGFAAIALIFDCAAAAVAAQPISFAKQIAPLISEQCLGCHSGEKPKGALDLTTRANMLEGGRSGAAVTPKKLKESLLLQQLLDKKMPPKNPLKDEQIALIQQWIEEGAAWEGGALQPRAKKEERAGLDWWSLQPIRRPSLPMVEDRSQIRNAIDLFVIAKQKEKGLRLSAEADRRTLIRRLYLDLTGLPPSPEEVKAFVDDPAPNAYEKLVDKLLASPAYGESWARHWLDVVRFAESHGYEMNTLRPNAYHYRDYVIWAFNRDLPFADFVRHQLAADAEKDAEPIVLGATGFLVAGPHDLVGNAMPEAERQKRSDDLFDMVSTTSSTFMGLTVGCARCHDHKFDPIPQKDFYSLESIFAGVDHAESPVPSIQSNQGGKSASQIKTDLAAIDLQLDDLEPLAVTGKVERQHRSPVNSLRNVERFESTRLKFLRFTVSKTNDGTQPCIDEIEVYHSKAPTENLALASRGVKATASSEYPNASIHKTGHINDGLLGNSHSWISNENGAGWIQLAFPAAAEIDRIIWARDREGQFRDRLPVDYRVEASMDGENWKLIAGSTDRRAFNSKPTDPSEKAKILLERRDQLQNELGRIVKPAMAYRGSFRYPDATYLLKRGDILQPGEKMKPHGLSAVSKSFELQENSDEQKRRLELANWIGDPANPLPARVFVNRLWHYHFGQGLVRTPSDFGFNGDRPVHPELLDFLATEFQASGGSAKTIHRLIVLSSTYRQQSRIDPELEKIDAGNRYLWRFGGRRLEAEKLRDSVLEVSGALNRKAGGPGYNLWDYSGYVIVFTPKAKLGEEEFRRMVYQFKPRTQQDGTFGVFDCPDATSIMPRRAVSTTPLQALNLFNDAFMLDQAERFALRLKKEIPDSQSDQIRRAFGLALQRPPSEREANAAKALVDSHGLTALCRALLNANEFVTLE